MYRTSDSTPRCTSCGAAEVTPETRFEVRDGYAGVEFGIVPAEPGTPSAAPTSSYMVNRARICVACGHVMYTLSAKSLEKLRASLPRLRPLGEK